MTDPIRHATRPGHRPAAAVSRLFCRFSSIKRNIPLVCRRLTAAPGRSDRNGAARTYGRDGRSLMALSICTATRTRARALGADPALFRCPAGQSLERTTSSCRTGTELHYSAALYLYYPESTARSFVPSSSVRFLFPSQISPIVYLSTVVNQQHVTCVFLSRGSVLK